jgi:ABC-type glycerol-3-phosphate transport system substrate-binding protein
VYLASVALLVAMGVFATGCGGSTKSKTTPTTTTTKALAESYSVVVTAIGYNGQKHNVVLTVVVQ